MDGSDDTWATVADQFVDGHYATLRGRVRTHVIHSHLRSHLDPPPLRIVDVGGGGGNQSLPLAAEGYDVTILDPSPAMLERAEARLAAAAAVDSEIDGRVRLVQAPGEEAQAALPGERFGGVLCHGVLMYLDDPVPLLDTLCTLADHGGIVSIVAKNVQVLAVRPALAGDWATALAAFDSDRQVNGLGFDTRGDDCEALSALLADRDVDPIAWYGVRLFTDGWMPDRPATDPDELVLQAELAASQRDPYRRLSRLFHLLGRRR